MRGGGQIRPFRDERLIRMFIQLIAQDIHDLHESGITHRNRHPENMYFDGPEIGQAAILLGEFVAAPSAVRQPSVYEPIEYALTQSRQNRRGGPKFRGEPARPGGTDQSGAIAAVPGAAARIAFCNFSKARTSICRTRSRLMP